MKYVSLKNVAGYKNSEAVIVIEIKKIILCIY